MFVEANVSVLLIYDDASFTGGMVSFIVNRSTEDSF